MGLPNWITVARIALIPPFLALGFARSVATDVASLGLFVVASASDTLDGYLARRWRVESRLGKFLDPLADKLLVGAALVVLVATRPFPVWAAVVLAAREIAVTALRIRIVRRGQDLPASAGAKWKTASQLVMVSWWLLPWSVFWAHWLWLGLALGVTLWSGLEYFTALAERERVT